MQSDENTGGKIMCVILSCEAGARPNPDVLEACWAANPDGGGVMWCEGGRVQISKGLMTLAHLKSVMGCVPDGSPMVVHMRIGTSGGYDPCVTHPFPVSDDLGALHALDVECATGIAHNGVLPIDPALLSDARGISDTVAFVRDFVAPLAARRKVRRVGGLTHSAWALGRLRRESSGSRLAIMQGDGSVSLIGAGWETVTTGIRASNSSWRGAWRATSAGLWSDCGDEPDDAISDFMDYWGCDGCPCLAECRRDLPICWRYEFEDDWEAAPAAV